MEQLKHVPQAAEPVQEPQLEPVHCKKRSHMVQQRYCMLQLRAKAAE